VIGGGAISLNSTACYSILSSDYRDNFQEVVGMLEMFTGLGIIVGPLITTSLYVLLGVFWAFTITALLTLSAAIPAYIWLGPARPYIKVPKPEIAAHGIITDPVRQTQTILADLMALCLGMFGVGYFDLAFTSYLVSLDYSPQLASCFFTLSCVTYSAFALVCSRISSSVDRRIVIFAGILAALLSFALCGTMPPLPHRAWIVALGSGLEGVGLSTIVGTLYSVAVYPHLLSHSSQVLKVPQDDLLSDKISSSL
jgi:MFS family permease